jgi:hypothetical protein
MVENVIETKIVAEVAPSGGGEVPMASSDMVRFRAQVKLMIPLTKGPLTMITPGHTILRLLLLPLAALRRW